MLKLQKVQAVSSKTKKQTTFGTFDVPRTYLYICVLVKAFPFHGAWRGRPAVVSRTGCVDLFFISLSLSLFLSRIVNYPHQIASPFIPRPKLHRPDLKLSRTFFFFYVFFFSLLLSYPCVLDYVMSDRYTDLAFFSFFSPFLPPHFLVLALLTVGLSSFIRQAV